MVDPCPIVLLYCGTNCLLMFEAQTLSPYLKLGSKLIFLVCLIVEGQEWVVGISYSVSGGLSGQCCHWIIIGSCDGGLCLILIAYNNTLIVFPYLSITIAIQFKRTFIGGAHPKLVAGFHSSNTQTYPQQIHNLTVRIYNTQTLNVCWMFVFIVLIFCLVFCLSV